MEDGSRMSRFEGHGLRRFTARQAVLAIVTAALLLVILTGSSIRQAGEEMQPGFQRDVVLAVGRPAGWVADRLPLAKAVERATSWLSPDDALGGGGFATGREVAATGVPAVTADAFDPATLGLPAPPRHRLHTLLVTGDSLSMPLDLELARRLSADGIQVIRDPHVGTGISKSNLLDWGRLATAQARKDHPDAVVVFIGANEGFPIPGPGGSQVQCCGAGWAAAYAGRARQMMNDYRRQGRARVYWLTLPAPRDGARRTIARVVNAALIVAAEPWRSQVRVLDASSVFTPGFRYRDAMTVGGRNQIVRESDGIHLNDTGARLAADMIIKAVDRDFTR